MLREDKFTYTIEEDGTVTIEAVGSISGQNHMSADELLAEVEKTLGGENTRTKKSHEHAHAREHTPAMKVRKAI